MQSSSTFIRISFIQRTSISSIQTDIKMQYYTIQHTMFERLSSKSNKRWNKRDLSNLNFSFINSLGKFGKKIGKTLEV